MSNIVPSNTVQSSVNEDSEVEERGETLINRSALKIMRMNLPAGEALPPNHSGRDLAVIVVAGRARLLIGSRSVRVEPGTVVDLAWGEQHGIVADEALRLIVVEARPLRDLALARNARHL